MKKVSPIQLIKLGEDGNEKVNFTDIIADEQGYENYFPFIFVSPVDYCSL